MKNLIFCSALLLFYFSSLKAQNLYFKSSLKLYNQISSYSSTVAIGDIDNDNDNDILDYNSDSLCYIWNENNGYGSFTAFHLIKGLPYGSYSEIKIIDFDKDGFNDIIAISNNSYTGSNGGVFVLKGIGNGNFKSTYQVLYYCNILDYDNDGDLDLVHIKDSSIFINRNTLSGFTTPEKIGNLPTINLSKVMFIKIADLNSDKHPDILFLADNSKYPYFTSPQYIFRSYNNTKNEFNLIDTLYINTGFMITSLIIDDLNNDNNKDIIAPSYQTYWFENINNFNYYKHYLIISGEHLIIEDINKDGFKDVITYGYDYLENNKDNSFKRFNLFYINGNFRGSLAAGDLDKDRDVDVIIGENNFDNKNAIRLYFNNFCKPTYKYEIIDICVGDSFYIDRAYHKNNGFYAYDTITNSKGCDSILGKYLVFHKCIKDYIDTTICGSDYNIISHCDTTFYKDTDSTLVKNMKLVCHRTIYKICEITDINDLHCDHLLNVFPNPSKDMVYINEPSLRSFELFDANGRLLEHSNGKFEIQLNSYKAGMYILKLYFKDNLVKSMKLIKE